MSNIANQKSILIKAVNSGSNFTRSIFCPFIPDAIEVKNIAINPTGANSHIIVSCNIPIEQNNNELFCTSVANGGFVNLNIVNTFRMLPVMVNGTYEFIIRSNTDSLFNFQGSLMFYINFIQYKK